MLRSQSAPGLGRRPPFIGYIGVTTISPGEEEAERLYYAAISTRLCKGGFVLLAKDLARESPDGSAYLTWLIKRGQQWPTVSAA